MKKLPLPPLVGGFEDGHVTWDRLESIDYDTLGYLLSCHLIIEHYMDHFLATYPGTPIFGWENAKLSFTQKIAMIGALPFPEPYNLPPVIKHLNVLRNRFGHNINTKLTETDLLPIREFLVKCITGENQVPNDPKEILHLFTTVVCAYMASGISFRAQFAKRNSS